MLYGRVIGNELRDVPPECLPVWGQRWSGYRAPHGPSPFSTRILSVDRMSEVGPVLTSPSQFDATYAEEDDWEDAHSESSQLYATFSSSPSSNQTVMTQPIPQLSPPSDHHSSNHACGSPNPLHRSNEHSPSQDSTTSVAVLLPRREFERPGIQHHTSDPLSRPSDLRHLVPSRGSHRSLENDYMFWNMERNSPSTQPSFGSSQEWLQHTTIPPHSIPEWWSTNAYAQSAMYPFHPNHPSYPYFRESFQSYDQPCFIPTTFPSSYFSTGASQRNVGVDSRWNDESGMTVTPGTHSNNPMATVEWPIEAVPPDLSFQVPLQVVGSSRDQEPLYHIISDLHKNSSYHEDSSGAIAGPENRTALSFDSPQDSNQYIR